MVDRHILSCLMYLANMNIGFDAKRAFHNNTGLGNYSRTLIQSLSNHYPHNHYYLFNPEKGPFFQTLPANTHEVRPTRFLHKLFPSLWRSRLMTSSIEEKVGLFHGLSNELPFGIHRSKVKKVVTIHDLIFESYPEQYKNHDVAIYRKKFNYAAKMADRVIAISESTKKDLIDFYSIDPAKIEVCYQSCDERFFTCSTHEKGQLIREQYQLHKPYFIVVGSIIERKNLLRVCEAFFNLPEKNQLNLVVIGKGDNAYFQRVKHFIDKQAGKKQVLFLESLFDKNSIHQDMPALYQNALGLVYPSMKEGFGIPVLEAMASGIPVITSNCSSMPEAGGEAALYVNPEDSGAILSAMQSILSSSDFASQRKQKSLQQAAKFSNECCAVPVMKLYQKLVTT